jgi:hypothetical protein
MVVLGWGVYAERRWLQDVSDAQYRTFRVNLPFMALLLIFHPLLRRVWNAVYPVPQELKAVKANTPDAAEARLRQRTSFDRAFAIFYLVALHGFSAAKILFILAINYKLATNLPKKYIPPVTWAFGICILFANELGKGFQFRDMARFITGDGTADFVTGKPLLVELGEWLDSYGGIMRRWEILFNITVLRLVSFNLDYFWSLDRRGSSPIEVNLSQPHPPFIVTPSLTLARRNNSTPPTSRSATASPPPPRPTTSTSATTSPTPSTRRSTSRAPSSPSTTSSPSSATNPQPSPPRAPSNTPSASPSPS